MDALLNKTKIAQTQLALKSENDINLCLKNIQKALLKNANFIIEENKTPHHWKNPVWRHADGSVAEW